MRFNAANKIINSNKNQSGYTGYRQSYSQDSWLNRMQRSLMDKQIYNKFEYNTTVHPCRIDGKRCLVFDRGLRDRQPQAYASLKKFAEENNFALKEDQRASGQPVVFERRKAKVTPLLFLASGLFLHQGLAAAESVSVRGTTVTDEMVITGKKESSSLDRDFKIKDGKRFVTDPYGDVTSILSVASETKRQGQLKRVSTRGIVMPQNYVGGIINRYDYQFPLECGGGKFSYYEGEGFGALGYHNGNQVVLDVMVGGGPFTAPQLWGPYDQVLGDNHNTSMKLMMGNGQNDGMGILKASYAIGMTPVMSKDDFVQIGNAYVHAIAETASCMVHKEQAGTTVIRQARNEW